MWTTPFIAISKAHMQMILHNTDDREYIRGVVQAAGKSAGLVMTEYSLSGRCGMITSSPKNKLPEWLIELAKGIII